MEREGFSRAAVTHRPRTCLPWHTLTVATLWLLASTLASAFQIPPSIRAATPAPAPKEELERECKEIKGMLDTLRKDPVWLRQPYSSAHVTDLQRLLTSLNCSDPDGALKGTWHIKGTQPVGPRNLVLSGTVTLEVVDAQTGLALANEPNWGMASSYTCRGRPDTTFFYRGTIKWDPDSFYGKSYVYRNDPPKIVSASGQPMEANDPAARQGLTRVVLCATSPEDTQVRGNYRDASESRGGEIFWNGMGEGYVIPEQVEGVTGSSVSFIPTRVK
jgi:hypothetical protein